MIPILQTHTSHSHTCTSRTDIPKQDFSSVIREREKKQNTAVFKMVTKKGKSKGALRIFPNNESSKIILGRKPPTNLLYLLFSHIFLNVKKPPKHKNPKTPPLQHCKYLRAQDLTEQNNGKQNRKNKRDSCNSNMLLRL